MVEEKETEGLQVSQKESETGILVIKENGQTKEILRFSVCGRGSKLSPPLSLLTEDEETQWWSQVNQTRFGT